MEIHAACTKECTIPNSLVFIYSILLYTLPQAPNRPPLVVAAGHGQLTTVQQLIDDGVGTLEDQDEVHIDGVLVWNIRPHIYNNYISNLNAVTKW